MSETEDKDRPGDEPVTAQGGEGKKGDSFHDQQLGGVGRTGEGSSRDLQEPSSAQGGG